MPQNEMLVPRENLCSLLKVLQDGSSWCDDPKYFSTYNPFWQLILNQAMVQQHLQVSVNFCLPSALEWLDAISELNAISSTILAIIHPNLYNAGWETTKHLKNTPEIGPLNILSGWVSVFSGIVIISNHSTALHWDGSSRWH